ncbi:YqgE/AlgH family protein [Rhodovarius crocodyli]
MAMRKTGSGAGTGPSHGSGDWLTGQLLIATPAMQDPRFAQTVICLCAHSADGAMGLVLNRPLDSFAFEDLLQQLGITPAPPARAIRMVSGGPVEGGRGFVLHSPEWQTDGTLPVPGGPDREGAALTASVEVLKAIAEGNGPRDCLLALGYAGWGPGQLEGEIAANAWLTVPADADLLFGSKPEATWRQALAKLKVDPLLLSDVAGHA